MTLVGSKIDSYAKTFHAETNIEQTLAQTYCQCRVAVPGSGSGSMTNCRYLYDFIVL